MNPICPLNALPLDRLLRRISWLRSVAALCALATLGPPALATASPVAPIDFVVVVNASNPVASLSTAELSQMFLQKTPRWESGEKVMAVDLTEEAPARQAFSKAIHDRTTAAVKAYWQNMIFSGRDVPPPEKASAADVLAYVRTNPGGIGYVPAGTALPTGVRAIKVAGMAAAATEPPAAEPAIFALDATMTRPEAISQPNPVYTDAARRARVEGAVTLQAIIDKEGNVIQVRVLKPLPFGLDKAALQAVRKWKFKPATRDGQPIAVYYDLTVNFTLQ